MHDTTEPGRELVAAALRALSQLATIPGAVVPARRLYVPAVGSEVGPVVLVVLVGSEREHFRALCRALTHQHIGHGGIAERRYTYGKLLGVWHCITSPHVFAPWADTPKPQPQPRPEWRGPLTDEKVTELVSAGVLTRALELAADGVPIRMPSDVIPLRRILLQQTTTLAIEEAIQEQRR